MLNNVCLMGRLTRDPEIRHTQSNMAVASFSLAVERDRKDASGKRQTDFIDIVAWDKRAEFVKQWFGKGQLAIVVGRIQSRSWEDKNGSKRVSIEVIADQILFGESKKAREESGTQNNPPADAYYSPKIDADDFHEMGDDDGDVPF